MTESAQGSNNNVVPMDPRMEISSFAVELPSTILQGLDEPDVSNSVRLGDKGMVGTIVYLKKSVMVWFGWGQLEMGQSNNTESSSSDSPTTRTVGSASNLSMGPLVVAMPRSKYQGAFSSATESSTSKLIGSDAEEEEMIARQMSSRLSQRLGISVFVSCSFAGAPDSQGVDEGMVQQRGAALAEREIYRIVKEKIGS